MLPRLGCLLAVRRARDALAAPIGPQMPSPATKRLLLRSALEPAFDPPHQYLDVCMGRSTLQLQAHPKKTAGLL